MLESAALDLDQPSHRESSTDTSSDSRGLLASTATSPDIIKDMNASLMSNAFMEESMCSFDLSNWEDWMQWDDNNIAGKLPVEQATNSPISYVNPSISSTVDNSENLNSHDSIDVRSSLESTDMPNYLTSPFAFTEMPFECGMNNPLLASDNELNLPVDITKPLPVEFPNSNSFSLAPFQFDAVPSTCSGLPPKQPSRQSIVFENSNLFGQNCSSLSDSRRSMSMSSPESNLSGQSRKRKPSSDDEAGDLAPTKSKRIMGPKEAHKVVEKNYRMNLNEKIAVLRDSIPSFQQTNKGSPDHKNDGHNRNLDCESRGASKPNKGLVLSKATEYIRHLERRNRKLNEEITILKTQLNAFKTLAMARPMIFSRGTVQDPTTMRAIHAYESRQPYQDDAQAVNQGHSQSHSAQRVGRQSSGGSGGGYMSKLMVGSLAAFMIIQGFSEKEQTDDTPSTRGLFGFPVEYIGSMKYWIYSTHQSDTFGYLSSLERPLFLFKAILLIGAIIYLIAPSFFDAKPRGKVNPISNLELTAAPPLASPIEVRRNAWLTAIQTVWVPRQSVLLQSVALVLKSLKLFLRNTIGWHSYAMLTGATEDQEVARVRAWEIALDAQLAGGDAEISMSRLILTMIASGTLPETPYRHMLRALHIHILLWEAANSRWGGWLFYRSFAAKLARSQWEKARKLQMRLKSSPSSNDAPGFDALPNYLAHLLELDSDTIMLDVVVQRAYNLAWNKPTADKISTSIDAMDSIIDDPAIRSPLDALAAWYSSIVLHEVLIISLEARICNAILKPAIQDGLEIALNIAPTGSLVQSRGLVARAMLLPDGRGANIAAALQALPNLTSPSMSGTPVNIGGASTSLIPPDAALSIRCSMAIALLKRPQYKKAAVAFSEEIRFSLDNIGLLGFTAMYYFLAIAFQDKDVANEISDGLENVARTLKLWIGRKETENNGLEKEAMSNVATLCVEVFNWSLGMSGDYLDSPAHRIASDG